MSSRYLARLVGFALVALIAAPVFPQEGPTRGFPNKPVRIMVGYGPGGGSDIVARLINGRMSEGLGQPVVIENKPGAQSIIAAEFVAKAPPDGYTLLMGPSGPMAVNPAIYAKLPYSPMRDFVPISMVGTTPLVLVVNSSLPVRSVKELVEYAKARPNQLNYASAFATSQLASELFNQKTGTRFVHVPYKSSAEMNQAIISGQVTMVTGDMKAMTAALKAGTIRGLAVLDAKRHPNWPDLPSAAEAGLPGMEVILFQGLFAPAGTPSAVVKILQDEVARVVKLPDISGRLENLGMDPSGNTSAEFGRILAADIAKWTVVAKAANIKAD